MVSRATGRGWLRSPLWDSSCLAFGWVPFYLWVLSTPLARPDWRGGGQSSSSSLAVAMVVAFALNFLHRHYVLVLIYGDGATFSARPRAYVVAPILAFAVVAGAVLCGLPKTKELLLAALGAWNVWHVVQQRYGLLRAYASRAGGGLESRDASRRDFRLLWSAVIATAPLVVLLGRSVIASRPESAPIFSVVGPWLGEPFLRASALVLAFLFALAAASWLRGELRARPVARMPRYVFVGSTFALLAVFVAHGPLVGYLVFGVAHSIEYLAFVHHFGERKYKRGGGSVAARLLGDIRRAPLILAPLLLAYLFLHEHRFSLAYVTYFSTTSTLHYLYDGSIWRLREPKVAEALVAST